MGKKIHFPPGGFSVDSVMACMIFMLAIFFANLYIEAKMLVDISKMIETVFM